MPSISSGYDRSIVQHAEPLWEAAGHGREKLTQLRFPKEAMPREQLMSTVIELTCPELGEAFRRLPVCIFPPPFRVGALVVLDDLKVVDAIEVATLQQEPQHGIESLHDLLARFLVAQGRRATLPNKPIDGCPCAVDLIQTAFADLMARLANCASATAGPT